MDINEGIYYIYSDREKGFWNNQSGWGAFESATEFTDSEMDNARQFVSAAGNEGSRIVTASEAETLCDDPDA